MSLATRLIAAIVGLLVLTVGAAGYYSARSIEELGRQEAARRRADGEIATTAQAELVVRNLSTSASLPLAESNTGYLESLAVKTMTDDPRIQWLTIVDAATGKVVASAGQAPAQVATEPLASPTAVAHVIDPADRTRHTFVTNVLVGARVIGQIRLGISTRSLEEVLARSIDEARARAGRAVRQLVVAAAVIALLGMLAGAYQGMRITRPLKALTRQAGAIANGDFQSRVNVASKDEIGQVAESFNSMAESLGRLIRQMAGKVALEKELELARSVQVLMSPTGDLVQLGGGRVVVAGHCEPATQCGGDWWTYRELSGGRVLIVVGDVTGHGMPAAMIAATARGAVIGYALEDDRRLTASSVLETVDQAIRDVGHNRLLMTAFALIFDPAAGIIQYANAGHVFPYIGVLETGVVGELSVLTAKSNPLGYPDRLIRTQELPLLPGHLIVLSSDGLADRVSPSGERFGDKRLRKLLRGHRLAGDGAGVDDLRDQIIDQVRDFAADQPADDDTTLVICRYLGSEAGSRSQGAVA